VCVYDVEHSRYCNFKQKLCSILFLHPTDFILCKSNDVGSDLPVHKGLKATLIIMFVCVPRPLKHTLFVKMDNSQAREFTR
jgi:hypothetical protein